MSRLFGRVRGPLGSDLSSVRHQHEDVGEDDHDRAEGEGYRRRIIVLLVDEGEAIGVEIGRVTVRDNAGRVRLQYRGFVEQLERTYDGENPGKQDRWKDQGYSDVEC